MSGPAAQLATLQVISQTETTYGGEAQAWTTLATLWVHLVLGAASADQQQDQPPVRIETATASARDHPDAAAGQQLIAANDQGGPPWRVLAVQRPQPGRMLLLLDRMA